MGFDHRPEFFAVFITFGLVFLHVLGENILPYQNGGRFQILYMLHHEVSFMAFMERFIFNIIHHKRLDCKPGLYCNDIKHMQESACAASVSEKEKCL